MPKLRLSNQLLAAVLLISTHLATAQEPPTATPATYDKSIFEQPIPVDQLTLLNQFKGVPAKDLLRDKQFHKMIRSVIPRWMFHYGSDMSLPDALDRVMEGSRVPVQIRDSRYLSVSGPNGPYLDGRGLIWIDLQDGIVLGAFYFHPTNGEPTPSVTVFSNQLKVDLLTMGELPPGFAQDLARWSADFRIPPVTTRYFIGNAKKKILLEHDEDYCLSADGSLPPPRDLCAQMNADASDVDLTAAYYLEQTHYATNATAWMITNPDQLAWIQLRNRTCGPVPDPLACHVRLTRERTRTIIIHPQPHPRPHPGHR